MLGWQYWSRFTLPYKKQLSRLARLFCCLYAPRYHARFFLCVTRSTARHSAAQRDTAQHSATQHSAAQRDTAQRSAAQRNTAQHSATQRSTAQHSARQRGTAQHSAAQRNTAQHSAAQKKFTCIFAAIFASLRGIDYALARQIKSGAIALNVQCKRSIKRAAAQRWRCQFFGVANKPLI